MTQSQRSRYVKTGGVLFFVVFLFYFLAPSGTSIKDISSGKWLDTGWSPIITDDSGGRGAQVSNSTPDPSLGYKTCTKSHDGVKPVKQYALMIDAGSTGSRIHAYRFNNCGATPELEEEFFKMTEKREGGAGLSAYKGDPEAAAKSLDMLMEYALESVPEEYRSCSPIALKATAGLRLIGQEPAQAILDAVRTRLETVYPFPVVSKEKEGVVIMEGKDEGVYAWITTNYLLGKIGGPDHTPTAAIFDLGGGSTQIVFEPTFKGANGGMPEKLAEGDHKYALNFGGRDFELYQHSHLGYGLMEARKSIHRALIQSLYEASIVDSSWTKKPIVNPCIIPGMNETVTVELPEVHALGPKLTVTMVGPSSPSAAQCRSLAEKILEKDTKCALAPCSFNGVHQPSLSKTFEREDIYTFSYFYDRTKPLGMPDSYTLKELHTLTSQVCGGEAHWDVFKSVPGALDELRDRPETCLDLSFMLALLHTGYEMPIDREVKIAKKIKGNELGWCLGAS